MPPLSPEILLARRVRAHNGQVALTTLLTALAVVAIWPLAFFLGYWIWLFLLSSIYGGEAQAPAHFERGFTAFAVLLLVSAALGRWLNPHPRLSDHRSPGRVALDFLLLLPRVTLSLADNLRAWVRLRPDELRWAVELVERVRAVERMPMYALPAEIPQEQTRERILAALLHLEILDLGRTEGVSYLRLVHPPEKPGVTPLPVPRPGISKRLDSPRRQIR